MASSFQLLLPTWGQWPHLPPHLQERGWEPGLLLSVHWWESLTSVLMGWDPHCHVPPWVPWLRVFYCWCHPCSGWVGAGGDGFTCRNLGLPLYGEKREERGSLQPVSWVRAWDLHHWSQLQKEELGANPLSRGLCREDAKERSPVRGWRGSAAPAQPLLQTRSEAFLQSSPRLRGRALPAQAGK